MIVVIAVTLTLVLCLVVAVACLTIRRRSYPSDKTPLTTVCIKRNYKTTNINNFADFVISKTEFAMDNTVCCLKFCIDIFERRENQNIPCNFI